MFLAFFIFEIMEVEKMRKDEYTPDVFEVEEKWQKQNPDWFRQYVEDDAETSGENKAEDLEETHPVMSSKDADDGKEYIPWDNTPVMPSRKGFYDDYSCYFNEYCKIPQDRRRDYAFVFTNDNKKRTYYAVMPGDASPADGKVVTEEDIAWLHRARDREVYRNNKEKHQESDDYDLLEAVEEEKVKMEKNLPNRYEELKAKLESYRLVINTGAIVDELGNDCTDHMMAFMGAPSVEAQLGLSDNPLADAFEEAEAQMTEDERRVFTLVYRKGMTRTAAAKKLGITESTVRYRLSKAERKVKEHPVIARTQRIYRYQYDRIEAWKVEKKARKRKYEGNKARRTAAKKAAKMNTDTTGMAEAGENA